MSRPPLGPALVAGLAGSDDARQRAQLILETIAANLPVQDAAARLGVSTQRFHELRAEALQQLIAACEAKPLGRPVAEPTVDERIAAAVAEKDRKIAELTVQVEMAAMRTELVALGLDRRLGKKRSKKRL